MKKDRNAREKTPGSTLSKPADKTHRSTLKLNPKHQQVINQHVPIGIVEASLEGNYIDFSEEFCHMLGYERQELLQMGIQDATHEDDFQIDIRLHGRLVAGEIPYYKIEKRYVQKNGQIIWVELTRSLVGNSRGKGTTIEAMIPLPLGRQGISLPERSL